MAKYKYQILWRIYNVGKGWSEWSNAIYTKLYKTRQEAQDVIDEENAFGESDIVDKKIVKVKYIPLWKQLKKYNELLKNLKMKNNINK